MDLQVIVVLALGVAAMLFIGTRWEHWFDPGWGLLPRLALFAFAGACCGTVVMLAIGTFLTAIGGIG